MFLTSICCSCGPAQCVFLDEFEENDLRYEAVDSSGNDASSVFDHDSSTGVVTATGSGSYTIKLAPPLDYIMAETLVADTTGGTGKSGVTIRRADSSGNVSLVRDWSVTDGYELRLGDTALASFTASGPARIKLRLVKDGSGGWDAEAYVGGTLQHTEVGIAFDKPAELNVGLIAEGGGEFEYLKASPCPGGRCPATFQCQDDVVLPIAYSLEASGINGAEVPGCPEGSEDICGALNGTWYLLSTRYVVFKPYNNPPLDFNNEWQPANNVIPECGFGAIFESRTSPPLQHDENLPDGKWALLLQGFFGECMAKLDYAQFDEFQQDINNRWWVITAETEDLGSGLSVRLKLQAWYDTVIATYYSDWEPISHDFTSGDVILNFDGQGNTSINPPATTCSFPATLTLKPNGESGDLGDQLTCANRCEPPLSPFAANQAVVTGQIGGDDYCGFMSATFNSETFSWDFEGLMNYTDSDDGVLKQFTIRIECVELNEGEGRNWRLFVDSGMDTTVLPVDLVDIINGDTFDIDFTGTVTVDGESKPIDGIVGECDVESHAFAECCDEETLCCGFQSVGLWAAASCLGPHPCDGGSIDCDALVSSLSPTSPDIWSGDTSVDDGIGGTYRVELECVGGSFELRVIDSADDVTTKNVQCSNCAGGSFELFTTDAVPFEGQIPSCCGGPPAVEFLRLIPT